MDIKVLLTPQVISCIIILGMLVLTIRSILLYTRHLGELQPRLQHLDRELTKRLEGMGDQRKAVAELTALVSPMQEREAALRAYCDELRGLEATEEKRALAQQQASEVQKKVRISRKKMGID